MPLTGNAIDNNPLAIMAQKAGPQVTAAIRQASIKTGVDFAYMMEKAAAESGFDADAKARTSSASGLYQFIESTWLQMVNRYGEKHGLGEYAEQISDSGRVTSKTLRKEILALRNDPEVASLMAGEFAAENRQTLINSGISAEEIGPTELYLAHFLGAGSAGQFIKAMKENPLTPAADIFPRAAAANQAVFYNSKTQQARSLAEVHGFFDKKFGNAASKDYADDSLIAQNTQSVEQPQLRIMAPRQIVDAGMNQNALIQAMAAVNYDHDASDIISIMGHGRPATAQSVQLLSGRLLRDPVAVMLMAHNDAREQDGRLRQ